MVFWRLHRITTEFFFLGFLGVDHTVLHFDPTPYDTPILLRVDKIQKGASPALPNR